MKRNEETEEGKGRKEEEMKGGDNGQKGIMGRGERRKG